MSDQLPIFVYGTLRPGQALFYTVEAAVTAHEPATLPGAVMYTQPELWFPYAVRSDDQAAEVHGDLLTLDADADAYAIALRTLDQIEGYVPGASDNHYERAVVDVVTRAGETRRAYVYLHAADDAYLGSVITSGDWRAALEQRAKEAVALARKPTACPEPDGHDAHLALNGECPWCGATDAVNDETLRDLLGETEFANLKQAIGEDT